MQARIKVWDGFVRLFHWLTVALFTALWLTGEGREVAVHSLMGYALATLIVLRIIWGFAGSEHARFNNFVRTPGETLAYLRDILANRPAHYLGHNPAGAAMVVALLLCLTGIIATGIVLLGSMEFEGPLTVLGFLLSDEQVHLIREGHAILVNLTLALVALHVLGVISASIQHKENLVAAMIHGYKNSDQHSVGGKPDASS
ncbi:cytochrome b/b6 domain-containing protein [Hahella sp. SMD15-11]|uniref:Cytochrome b/b6 domain-containing protein n=1 Tax=Thermohahella caldifontis TaxID=3142973 RepID=A0AB39UYV6_9GAMM